MGHGELPQESGGGCLQAGARAAVAGGKQGPCSPARGTQQNPEISWGNAPGKATGHWAGPSAGFAASSPW